MVRPIKNEPQRHVERTQKSHGAKKPSKSLQDIQKATASYMKDRGMGLLRAGKPPKISDAPPKRGSQRVAKIAESSPSLSLKKRSK